MATVKLDVTDVGMLKIERSATSRDTRISADTPGYPGGHAVFSFQDDDGSLETFAIALLNVALGYECEVWPAGRCLEKPPL